MKDVLVKKSKIQGKGIFANRNFKKGEVVIRWKIDRIFNKQEICNLSKEEYKHVNRIGRNQYIIASPPESRMNHSCIANTIIKNNCDVAIRNIKKGEEITSDYVKGKIKDSFICNCGGKHCRGGVKIR